MGRWRVCTALLMAMLCGSAVGSCGATAPAAPPAPTAVAVTPSTNSPGGALTGFLSAARAQDMSRVPAWLATSTDTTSLADLLRVYSDYSATAGIFWAVAGVRVSRVTPVDATHADVGLSGPVAWCVGITPDDPAALCNVVTGVAGAGHTYAAIAVDGTWKADIDVSVSSRLDHNPQASPTATAPTPSST